MKNLFLSCFLLLGLSGPLRAQTIFAPQGAQWWYRISTIGGPGVLHQFVDGDTVLQGQTCRRIYVESWLGIPIGSGQLQWIYSGPPTQPSLFLFTQGDRVYRQYPMGPAELLMDFGRSMGDSWTIRTPPCMPDTVATIRVDSTSDWIIGGIPLRYQHLAATSATSWASWMLSSYRFSPAVERLGHLTSWLVPRPECATDPEYYSLAQYSDSAITYGIRPTIVTGLPRQQAASVITVSPNPAVDGRFTVTSSVAPLPYTVCDALGRVVRTGQLATPSAALDLSGVAPGVYWLRTAPGGGAGTTRRLLIGAGR